MTNHSTPSSTSSEDIEPTYTLEDYVKFSQEEADELIVAHLRCIDRYADAGHWGHIREVTFEEEGRWLVAMALSTSAPTPWLAQLATVRDRLVAAMECENVHGVDSLIKPDHPFTLWLEELRKDHERAGRWRSPSPLDSWSRMPDWRMFDFTDAARSGLRPGTPPPSPSRKDEPKPSMKHIPQPPPGFWAGISDWCVTFDFTDAARSGLPPETPPPTSASS